MAGSRLARNEGQKPPRRSLVSTTPADLPPSRRAWLSDLPGWCVDKGPTLVAMTTCDLWLALARGDVAPQVKVWREGMPYWEAVATVPELALAMPDVAVWGPDSPRPPISAVATVAAAAAVATAEARDRPTLPVPAWPSGSPVVRVATLAPPANVGDFATPAPMVVEHRTAPPPSGTRRRFPKLDRRSAASVAFGAAVAIAALAVATSRPVPGHANTEKTLNSAHAAAMGAPEKGVSFAELPIAPEAPRPQLDAAITLPERAAPEARRPRGPRAADRGQRRARAGSTEDRSAAGSDAGERQSENLNRGMFGASPAR